MAFETVTLADLRRSFEVLVEKLQGDSTDWRATVILASHTGVDMASGVRVEIAVSARTGEAKYTCELAFWGSKLPEFVPALHEAIIEFTDR